ncbi:MAG: type II toxin-antitoxin system MqsA family antitoxin [Oribacterium sp.]|nr:type II toxin-antitoxin system MqsA family antitoxin [Oribacterium sp.]
MLSVRYGRLPFYCSCDKILLSTGRKYFKQGNETGGHWRDKKFLSRTENPLEGSCFRKNDHTKEEVSSMRCMDCGGKMVESTTVFTVQFGNSVIVIKNVPCFECEICGYTEFSDEVSEKLEKMVNIIKKSSQEVAVLDYNKAA